MSSWNGSTNAATSTSPMLDDDEAKLARVVPPGFKFIPSDAQLIDSYLARKQSGEELEPNRMKEVFDFYNHHPKELTQKYKGYGSNGWYFFTRRYPGDKAAGAKVNNGKRDRRVAGQGFWLSTADSSSIYSKGDLIGWKDTWAYYEVQGPEECQTGDEWILCGVFDREEKKNDDMNK
ncbi:hypothetical protein MKW94_000573 [Papaver nudicaule]|uniref:NAC domain-containing protein n=1 Tax=Papaver nudicaule TaxID=74823 RepID=A0AA41VG05_PAPNU|nr:hypothetical protein [Papaver nudicaule]